MWISPDGKQRRPESCVGGPRSDPAAMSWGTWEGVGVYCEVIRVLYNLLPARLISVRPSRCYRRGGRSVVRGEAPAARNKPPRPLRGGC